MRPLNLAGILSVREVSRQIRPLDGPYLQIFIASCKTSIYTHLDVSCIEIRRAFVEITQSLAGVDTEEEAEAEAF
jgi:hypothetical protein